MGGPVHGGQPLLGKSAYLAWSFVQRNSQLLDSQAQNKQELKGEKNGNKIILIFFPKKLYIYQWNLLLQSDLWETG